MDPSGTFAIEGNSVSIGGLSRTGIVQDDNPPPPPPLTVSSATNSTFDGILQHSVGDGSLSLAVIGCGTFTLSETDNTYTGSTTVNGSTLAIVSLTPGGSPSSIGASTNTASNLVLQNGGVLDYTTVASTANTDRSLTIGASGGEIDVDDPGSTLTLSGSVTGGNGLTTGRRRHPRFLLGQCPVHRGKYHRQRGHARHQHHHPQRRQHHLDRLRRQRQFPWNHQLDRRPLG